MTCGRALRTLRVVADINEKSLWLIFADSTPLSPVIQRFLFTANSPDLRNKLELRNGYMDTTRVGLGELA